MQQRHFLQAGSLLALLLGISLLMPAAAAVSLASFSPVGEASDVRQVRLQFNAPLQAFGDAQVDAPAVIDCKNQDRIQGHGRWLNGQEWIYEFEQELPPGVRCRVEFRPEFSSPFGPIQGASGFSFNTGAPRILNLQPWPGSQIEEDQHFLLELSGPIAAASLASKAWCEVQGLGERLPLRLLSGAQRDAVLKLRAIPLLKQERYLLLSCQRPLPGQARVRLVFDAGIAAAQDASLRTSAPQRIDYQVRAPLTAEFSCERERAGAACMPIRPLLLRFSEPVAAAIAQKARLHAVDGRAIAPIGPSGSEASTQTEVSELRFPAPLPPHSSFTLVLPDGLRDGSGRALANAGSFPLKVSTGALPPLAKFAAAPFGVLEYTGGEPALLPLTLRHLQSELASAAGPRTGTLRSQRLDEDIQVLRAYQRLQHWHEAQLSARELGLPREQWTQSVEIETTPGRRVKRLQPRYIATRELPWLANVPSAQRLALPQPTQAADKLPSGAAEVIGLPLRQPGFHLLEIESPQLGAALLDAAKPMYVRTGVLLTNLGVHFKWGRDSSAIWVTRLDRGEPVADAELAILSCEGKSLWTGRSDGQGLARVPLALELPGAATASAASACAREPGFFVSARKRLPDGQMDMAFVMSHWTRGIEPWRFGQPMARGSQSELRSHTVLDRSLLRAGETLSMKHFLRRETAGGLALVEPALLADRLRITHEGSGQSYEQVLSWTDPRSSHSQWQVPPAAKLGLYRVELLRGAGEQAQPVGAASASFRVEEFRVPLVDARLTPPKGVQVAPQRLEFQAQLNFMSGGAMADTALQLSALLRPRSLHYPAYPGFSFAWPRAAAEGDVAVDEDEGGEGGEPTAPAAGRLLADKLQARTDAQGSARLALTALPALQGPSELLAELRYSDPNGEQRSVSQTLPLWSSGVVLGLRTGSWVSRKGRVAFQVLALDTDGRPLAKQAVTVQARLQRHISGRKRMVGGFYAYENRREVRPLGQVCGGSTDNRGLLSCEAQLEASGEIELVAASPDRQGRIAQAASSVWITGQGELWFAQDNDDRIDVLPEKPAYAPGETARLQVRMPFRSATALLTVEREGVIESRVVSLSGRDPSIELKIGRDWAPNVYVSVLALRGRVREVPWYSFFSWGWRSPAGFWREWREARRDSADYQPPSALVDLAKPAFKLGVAALKVGLAAHKLKVEVSPDKSSYGLRQTARVRVRVSHDGKPVAGARMAFAAVDEGLLELQPNHSWELLSGLLRERAWGVQTATGQSEIVGRRHYGRKAVAAGGGGGRAPSRELFDTLLLWRPDLALDARGEATVEVPLNDSLTRFRLVAIADAGAQQFGQGASTIRVSQDLQLLPGLPQLVREGDRFQAMLTVRNSTAAEMRLTVQLRGVAYGGADEVGSLVPAELSRSALPFAPQTLSLAAGQARELQWAVQVPAGSLSLAWEAEAQQQDGPARDRLSLRQQVQPAVPLQVQQASLAQLEGAQTLTVAPPAQALRTDEGRTRGAVQLVLRPRLADGLPGLQRFFQTYPYSCLEQQASRALALGDGPAWQALLDRLPSYLDADGLAAYFPAAAGQGAQGSDSLSAYLLSVSEESGQPLPGPLRERLSAGLRAFVEGRLERDSWSPRPRDEDLEVRRLAALEALSRHGQASARMLDVIDARHLPRWPTAAVIDWLQIHRRLAEAPQRSERIAAAQALLRSRISYAGSSLVFSNDDGDAWWWLMGSADGNAARLLLAMLDDAGWQAELPRLLQGLLARQRGGAWGTTTGNLWGLLALRKFSQRFESQAPGGRSEASLAGAQRSLDWQRQPKGGELRLPWPAQAAPLQLRHQGEGRPWLQLQSLAAVPLLAPQQAGYRLHRTVEAVQQRQAGRWSRGDVLRVRLTLEASADMSWVALSDPLPAGAVVLGSGLGGQGSLALLAEPAQRQGGAWLAYEERAADAWRAYYRLLPRGKHQIEYLLRLNTAGRFQLPPSRIEAMYAPDRFGALPNAVIEVQP